ncbi:MAG TPA: N-acetylneuraminate synthase family protein [Syntrophomonadaceae bacterium]|nr:N-acetylneuraminate synthase family protein [Syntrophomonadaceae bacterium]
MRIEPPIVIAEIGCNHKGDLEIAKEMILTAKVFCKVDAVKFQKRSVKEILTPEEYNAPHPNPYHSYGKTYGEHREFLEFSLEQHLELKKLCDEQGITYSCSVWDLTSAKEIASLDPPFIKIPSALSDNYEVLGWLCSNYSGDIHVSTGMTTKHEIKSIVDFFIKHKRNHDLVLYHCTSGYPIEFKDACLLEIVRLRKEYGDIVKAIGFSGHHNGIAIDIAAYTLGASIIERHYTLDRTWKGTDHAASLEPDGLRKLKRDLMAAYEALQFKQVDILEIEEPQRRKLRWNRNQ